MTERLIKIKRIYEIPAVADGRRILVDRLWPRGLKKEDVAVDEWLRDIAPSPDLRTWFCHRPERFLEFQTLYQAELREEPVRAKLVDQLATLSSTQPVTLLYAAKDVVHNHAIVLAQTIIGYERH